MKRKNRYIKANIINENPFDFVHDIRFADLSRKEYAVISKYFRKLDKHFAGKSEMVNKIKVKLNDSILKYPRRRKTIEQRNESFFYEYNSSNEFHQFA